MTDFIRHAPDWLIPGIILTLSVVGLAIILERSYLLLLRIKTGDGETDAQILAALETPGHPALAGLLAPQTNPAHQVIEKMAAAARAGRDLAATTRAEVHRMELRLRRFLQTLGTISTVAPLLGLLGTVTGMIKSFRSFAQNRVQDTQLMTGIDEALLTTALGLLVAIPAMIAYNYFANRVNTITEEMNLLVEQATAQLNGPAQKATNEAGNS